MAVSMALSRKLALGFGGMIFLMLVLAASGFYSMRTLSMNVNELSANWLPSMNKLADINESIGLFRRLEFQHVLATDDAEMAKFEHEMDEALSVLAKHRDEYQQLISSPEERALYREFEAAWDSYIKNHAALIEISRKNATEQARKNLAGESRTTFQGAVFTLNKLIDLNDKGGANEAATGLASYQRGMYQMSFILAVSLALGIAVAVLLIRGVTSQLGEDPGYLAEVAGKIAGGDLNVAFRPQKKEGGVYQVLQDMVATMKAKIAEADQKSAEAAEQAREATLATEEANVAKAAAERAKAEGMMQAATQLEKVVEVVSSASEELSAQIEQSSRGAEAQASRAGETATAMEEMNSTVLEVARNASQAAASTDDARKKATEGARVVSKVVDGIGEMQRVSQTLRADMETLGKQAEGIGQIMNVISDIADQTNLLALNAAIEAARAGDAGRGFAVVADEVRKLAEKTMTATREVGEAISGIQQGTRKNLENVEHSARAVDSATVLAQKSGEALNEIVSMVDTATDQVRAIATASEQQSATSEEINRSIEDINRISSETSSAMNQSALAVGELATQAQSLRTLIEKMKTGG